MAIFQKRVQVHITLAILLAAVLLPVYWVLLKTPSVGLFHDDGIYLITAKALAEGKGYRIISLPVEIPQTKYPILFPLVLSAVWRLDPAFPSNLFLLKLIPFVCGVVWLAFSYRLLRAEGSSAVFAVWAVFLTAATPIAMFVSTALLSETMFAALTLGSLLALRELERGHGGSGKEWYAGLLAGLALLVRTAALPLVLAGTLCLGVRRDWKSGARFLAMAVLLYLPWMIWVARHSAIPPAEAYYSAQNYRSWNVLFNFTGPQKIEIVSHNVFLALIAFMEFGLSPLLARLTALVILAGLAYDLRRGISVVHVFAIPYVAMVLCWAWLPARFLALLFPLFLFWLWRRIEKPFEKWKLVRVVAVVVFALWIGNSLRLAYQARTETLSTGIVHGTTEKWPDTSQLLSWIRDHTPSNALLAGNLDPVYYLFTNRKAIRGFTADPYVLLYSAAADRHPLGTADTFAETLLAQNAAYLVVTPNETFAEKQHLLHLIADLDRLRPGSLRVVYQGPSPDYRVYQIDRDRLSVASPR